MLQFEVAGTVIQVGDDEAALVLYADCQYKGKTITIWYQYFPEGGFQGSNLLDYQVKMTASIIERNTPSGSKCAAIFPRIPLEDYGFNHRPIYFDHESGFFDTPTSIEVYAGNVTEAYLEKK